MSFSGTFNEEEFKEISVDNFEKRTKLYFLSHFHSDHYKGLMDSSFVDYFNDNTEVILYCSEITRNIVGRNVKIDKSKIVVHEEDDILICPENEAIKVTAMRAGHCPGSLMYLFESSRNNVLYTGDFRLSMKDLGLRKMLANKKIDSLYLDTTFASTSYERFPSRKESFKHISKIIHESRRENENSWFAIETPAFIGQEYLMVKLYEEFKEKIWVFEEMAAQYTSNVKQLVNVVTSNPKEANIFFYRSANQLNDCGLDLSNKITIKPSAQWFHKFNLANGPVQRTEVFWRVAYSSHSSLEEIARFVKFTNPAAIFPIATANCVSETQFFQKMNVSEMVECIQSYYVPTVIERKHGLEEMPCGSLSKKLRTLWEEEQEIIRELDL